ncbi:MAG: hypothetical protein GY898_03685 [Proteobacteria bacterium]|nr:hypothetical protein [Pseudomonadota bacterium]
MTVPQDAVLCATIGVATHLASYGKPALTDAGKRTMAAGFLAGWVPLTAVLLTRWPDWSWWYWEPMQGNPALALGVGATLEVAAYFAAFRLTQALEPPARLKLLAALGVLYGMLIVLPWNLWGQVGTAAEHAAGTAPYVWEAMDLMITLGIGGAWMAAALGLAVHRTRRS